MRERLHIRHMDGYTPGLQPEGDVIKLNTNENPFPPSRVVMARLADIPSTTLQRYPDPSAAAFRIAAARVHGLTPDQVIATNGGDELLRLALTTFVDPWRPVGIVSPGYGVYSTLAAIHQAMVSEVSLTNAWDLPTSAASHWNDAGAQLAFLTNPHAPSGTLFPLSVIEKLADAFKGVLVIDEAYVDFVDPARKHDATTLIAQAPNILLLRTLSKGYSLAGLRLGYGLGDKRLIGPMLGKTKDSYNVDAIAQALGTAALDDQAYAKASWEEVRRERATLSESLRVLGFDVVPSETNFLLVSMPAHRSRHTAAELYAKLIERSIFVRWFDTERLRDKLRITIGNREEHVALVAALREIID
jgi:histidinol-phosphate aminotransferase